MGPQDVFLRGGGLIHAIITHYTIEIVGESIARKTTNIEAVPGQASWRLNFRPSGAAFLGLDVNANLTSLYLAFYIYRRELSANNKASHPPYPPSPLALSGIHLPQSPTNPHTAMPPLPTEIWLQILSHCPSNHTLWLSLRLASSQLHACVDQHFQTHLLPLFNLALPITIPSYDQRNPLRGKARFQFSDLKLSSSLDSDGDSAVFELVDTEPEYYRTHFLSRWQGLRREGGSGELKEVVRWEVEFEGRKVERVRLWEGRLEGREEGLRLSFGWREMVAGFYAAEEL